MPRRHRRNDGETLSYVTGLIFGFILSAPVAAWLSPRSGEQTRREIRQRGYIIRRRVGQAVQQVGQLPAQVGQQIGQVQEKVGLGRGESIEDALAEGKAIAAKKRSGSDE
jgi:hypothetical protein